MLKRVSAVIAIAAVVAIVWWRSSSTSDDTAVPAAETAVARKGTLEVTVDATGSLAPAAQIDLALASGGRVAEVLAELGDTVGAGQPIVVIETDELGLALASAEASRDSARSALASAQASLADLRAGPSQIEIDMARIKLDKAKDDRWGRQAQRDAICGRVENKKGEQADCDSAQSSVLSAEDSVKLAELDLAAVMAGAAASETSAARAKVDQAASQLAVAETQVEQARLRLREATLTSPITGTVTLLDARPGQQVAGGTVATVSDLSRLEVEVLLDQTDIAAIAVGQAARVSVDAFPDVVLQGEVMRIAPVAETQSGVVLYPVTVRVEPGETPVRPGMSAAVSIVTAATADALIVPRRAIRSQGDRRYVELQTDAGSREVDVTLGQITETDVDVTDGLAEGDVVSVSPAASASSPQNGGSGGPGGLFGPVR